jgi:hypothetical protein
MDQSIYVISRLNGFWAVRHDGDSLGTFAARSDALRFAIQNACGTARNGLPLDVMEEDYSGARYLLWNSRRDSYFST